MKYAASFIGWSNTGKTSVIESLVQNLRMNGYTVSCLKRSHVSPNIDSDGRDTDRFFRAGAERVAYFSEQEGFLRFRTAPDDEDMQRFFEPCDVLLCEGFIYPGAPCFEVIGSGILQTGLKGDHEGLSAYISTGKTADTGILAPEIPVYRADRPDLIISYMEEIWTKKLLSK